MYTAFCIVDIDTNSIAFGRCQTINNKRNHKVYDAITICLFGLLWTNFCIGTSERKKINPSGIITFESFREVSRSSLNCWIIYVEDGNLADFTVKYLLTTN